jgi:hypothetical protein
MTALANTCLGSLCTRRERDNAGEEEMKQTDQMINHMLLSYVSLLAFGWGLLFFDWAVNELEKHPKAEPWINDGVTIGGASAVLSPIIQWGHAIVYTNPQVYYPLVIILSTLLEAYHAAMLAAAFNSGFGIPGGFCGGMSK